MPSLGADMTDGVLLEWLVKPGVAVHKGDIVAVVDTDKAAIEVECFDSGTVQQILVEPGTRVPVGAPLAVIASGEQAIEPAAGEQPTSGPARPVRPVPDGEPSAVLSLLVRHDASTLHVDLSTLHGTGPGGRITRIDVERAAAEPTVPTAPAPPAGRDRARVSPRARRLARDTGVDLSTVTGSGPAGAVSAADVQQATRPHQAASQPTTTATPTTGETNATEQAAQRAAAMRNTIAALMARSKREIPHYYLTEAIDLTDALSWLHDRNQTLPVPQRTVPAALLLKAAARAANEVPELNGFWIDDHFLPAPSVNLGVAVSLRGGGLVAPAIADADALSLDDLMNRLKDLVTRTRAGRLRGSELSSPTITVSNLGEQGVESIIGVIYPPQVALVGFGTVTERPWAVHGLLGIRRVVTASLAADHRATDGATGSRYLRTLARLLQRPEEL